VDAQIEELDKTAKPAPIAAPARTGQRQAQAPHPEITEWIGQNPWYNDGMLGELARAIDTSLLREKPGLPIRDRLALVKDELVKRYPEKFGNPRRESASAVGASPGTVARRRTNGHTYDDLPPEAKRQCDKTVAQFKGHKKPFTREEYVRDYDWGDQ
jgi:hypothetical protein